MGQLLYGTLIPNQATATLKDHPWLGNYRLKVHPKLDNYQAHPQLGNYHPKGSSLIGLLPLFVHSEEGSPTRES